MPGFSQRNQIDRLNKKPVDRLNKVQFDRNSIPPIQEQQSVLNPVTPAQPIQSQTPATVQPIQSQAPVQPIQPIQGQTQPAFQVPKLQPAKLSDFAQEAAKIYGQYNQGGYKQQLQPTMDYIQSQIPEVSKQFMQKAYRQNIAPETGLGGQIAAKLLSDFQTNVLAPVLQQVGTQQAINAPREQLQIAQNLQQEKQAEIDRQIANLQNAIQAGEVKEENVRPILSQIYGIDESVLNAPDTRQNVIDQYVQDAILKQQRTPDINELNRGLSALKMQPVTQEEFNMKYGSASTPQINDVKISSLISKLDAGQISEDTAAKYGVPYVPTGTSWNWEDTPETRARIKQLYTTNPDFRVWFDFNA